MNVMHREGHLFEVEVDHGDKVDGVGIVVVVQVGALIHPRLDQPPLDRRHVHCTQSMSEPSVTQTPALPLLLPCFCVAALRVRNASAAPAKNPRAQLFFRAGFPELYGCQGEISDRQLPSKACLCILPFLPGILMFSRSSWRLRVQWITIT